MNTKAAFNNIGILGGSFDPLHVGHIEPTREVANLLGFDRVILMPAYISPLKDKTIASAKHRLAMLQSFCETDALFSCDSREISAGVTSYTINTLQALRQEHPDSQLNFFMGMDSLLTLDCWHKWQEIVAISNIIVTSRPGFSLAQANATITKLVEKNQRNINQWQPQQSGNQIYFCNNKPQAVSSTEIRQRIQHNLTCEALLPEVVMSYIKQHALYQ